VLIKSPLATSTTEERVTFIYIGSCTKNKVVAGKIICRAKSIKAGKSLLKLYIPELGSNCNFTAKNKIKIIPTQNAGKQYRTIATLEIVLSINFPKYRAAIAPSIVPTMIVNVSLNNTNIKVTFNFS